MKKKSNEVFALIIYDIVDNKRRSQLVKYLQGYGFRVQKSCFEVILNKSVFKKLKMELLIPLPFFMMKRIPVLS